MTAGGGEGAQNVLAALEAVPPRQPLLLTGPTASGKSGLALAVARSRGGVIVNADALQVYACWRTLTARPSRQEEAEVPHALFGQLGPEDPWSVGHWLRAVAPLLQGAREGGPRPVIVGGTGLYLSALTEGLSEIPPIPAGVRALADRRLRAEGPAALLAELDAATLARLDHANPARVQRAWEVQRATGRSLAHWHRHRAPPLLPLEGAAAFLLQAPAAALAPRIEARFDAMLEGGALDEVRRNLPLLDRPLPAMQAIGARALAAHLQGEITLDEARAQAVAATRRYAKRQRTWFRARMKGWTSLPMPV